MNRLKFGKICSPSTLLDTDIIEAVEITSSFGGGMGGARKTYYAVNVNEENKPLELKIVDIKGREIALGYNFIVSQEKVRLIKITHDVTAHRNYQENRVKKAIIVEYSVLRANETFDVTYNIVRDQSLKDKVVFTDSTIDYLT
jgi:hypothetical protein